jgi:hypothetical protein
MLYATVCHGAEFIEKYSLSINEVGKVDDVFVLTDQPKNFPNCNILEYEEFMGSKKFMYTCKLDLIFHLLKQLKQRVNYVDADFLNLSFDKSLVKDDNTLFTSIVVPHNNTALTKTHFDNKTYEDFVTFMKKNNLDVYDENYAYITEAFLSFPYLDNTLEIASRSKELQAQVLEVFNQDTDKWSNTALKRYAKVGSGFGEGSVVTILAKEFNINVEGVSSNRKLFKAKKLQ